MKELPAEFLAVLHLPVLHEDDLDQQAGFFGRDAVSALYNDTLASGAGDAVLHAAAALLPGLHPWRAALLAILGGALVENGADPQRLFPAAVQRLAGLLASLEPYCAGEPMEDDDEAGGEAAAEEAADVAAWRAAEAALEALPPAERLQVEARRQAVDMLVLPLMAMLMRDARNHRALLADEALCARIAAMSVNGTLPFDQLHFLHRAVQMAWEDELVVLLPASGAGMIVRAQGINNNFHAFSLLQDLFDQHAQALGLRPRPAEAEAEDEDEDDDDASPRERDSARYLWLQATAYAGGELVDRMAWAWGEGTLRENARRQGRLVLVALDTDDRPERSWSGFNQVFHSAQQPRMTLVRFLAADEVAAYLA